MTGAGGAYSKDPFTAPAGAWDAFRSEERTAVGETAVILMHPPLSVVGASIGIERGCQQNDSLADGAGVELQRLPREQDAHVAAAAAGDQRQRDRRDGARALRRLMDTECTIRDAAVTYRVTPMITHEKQLAM